MAGDRRVLVSRTELQATQTRSKRCEHAKFFRAIPFDVEAPSPRRKTSFKLQALEMVKAQQPGHDALLQA